MNLQELNDIAQKNDLNIMIKPFFNNAYYLPKGGAGEDDPEHMQELVKDRGAIIIGDSNIDKTMVMHEVGHSKTYSPLAPQIDNIWNKLFLPVTGSILAAGAGHLFPQYKNVFTGINLGAQALSAVPTLISEYQASEKAKELDPTVDKAKLDKMYNSYLIGMGLSRLGIPLAIHGLDRSIL